MTSSLGHLHDIATVSKARDVNKHELPRGMFLFTLKAMTIKAAADLLSHYHTVYKPEVLIGTNRPSGCKFKMDDSSSGPHIYCFG